METSQRDWAYAIQKLIQYGHRLDDIREYTFKQFNTFVDAVGIIDMENQKAMALAARLGAQASDEDFSKALKALK